MKWLALALAATALAACSTDDLEASCDGEAVDECLPYTYAIVRSASVEPDRIKPGDPSPESIAHIRVEYDSCRSSAPGNHRISLSALTSRAAFPDASASLMLIDLDTLPDDGMTNGDEVARDGIVDVNVANPFFDLPPDTTVTLRFAPQLMSCTGGAHEIEYTTGPMWEP